MEQSKLTWGKSSIRMKIILFAAFQIFTVSSCIFYVLFFKGIIPDTGKLTVFSVMYFCISGLLLFRIISSFQRSLYDVQSILNELVSGNTAVQSRSVSNELGTLTQALNELANNLNRASDFARRIGEGNSDYGFKPLGKSDVLGSSLINMRDTLSAIREADKKRSWVSEGLALFADFIRKSNDLNQLSDTLIRELVKYTKSNQGGLFIVNRHKKDDHHLELVACYAYDRKKFLEKRIETGQGLLGQCYLEGQTVFLTEVPADYINITSGLGNANPSCILIVPLKLNDSTEGVIELATFEKYENHEIEFVQKVGEIFASAISNARVSSQTLEMLEQSRQQSEEMRAQEEELRQNMEEMQATQELMHRQANEMKKMQTVLELEKSMFNVLMEFLPDRITYKDTESRILRINKAKAQRLNMTPEEVIGKTDYDFFAKEHAEKAMREEKELIDSGKPLIDIEEKLHFNNGDTAWVSTSRIPFKNEEKKVTGMFIITKDITRLKTAELSVHDRDRIIAQLMAELPLVHYRVNREGLISEVSMSEKTRAQLKTDAFHQSKKLQDVFPLVSTNIQMKNGFHSYLSCVDGIVLDGVRTMFRHNIFSDSVHEGSYHVYALKIDHA